MKHFAIRYHFLIAFLLPLSLFASDPDGYPRLMQGPMIGAVDESSALIWVRGSWTWPVNIIYSKSHDMTDTRRTKPVQPAKEHDYCLTIPLTGLEPDTRYYYRVEIDGHEGEYLDGKPSFTFKTAPAVGAPARFRVAYGSCARWQSDQVQPIWEVLPRFNPDLFFWLGDNVYGDTLDPDILAEEYGRQREVYHLKPILSEVPQLAIWDDHDFGLNDHNRTNPMKAENLQVWKNYWPNPSHGLPQTPGVFFKYPYGGVDFFFLDGRYHRDPNEKADGPEKTMLGQAQLDWLKKGLLKSDAAFKVLVSGSVWTRAKGATGDAWSAFLHERNHLFDWIRDNEIEGVVLLSGDTHTGELNVIPWSENGGYDLYDITASPLAQEAGKSWLFRDVEQRLRLPYNLGPNFGLLEFDLTGDEPTLTCNLVGLEAKYIWEPLLIKASDLVNGKSTWKDKQSDDAIRWMDQFTSGWSDE